MSTIKKYATIAITLGVIGGVILSISSNKDNEYKAEAAWIQPGLRLYFSAGPDWDDANAWFAGYFFEKDVGERGWIKLNAVSGKTDLFYLDYPSWSWSNYVIFTRMNPASQDLTWANTWNQTQDLTYDGTKQHYVVPDFTGSWYNPGNECWTNLYENESVNFASNFVSTVGGACDPTGASNNITDPMWTGQTTSYNAMESGSKTYFTNTTSNSTINNAKSLHNYIVSKYSRTAIF